MANVKGTSVGSSGNLTMSADSDVTDEKVYDLLGIGFGPANLSLAIALKESQEAQRIGFQAHFVEKQPGFAWHSSLLLPGSQLQVSPMKDLATMRDPTSSFTFTNYLFEQGRLAAYINREASIPSRREWSAYLHWAAKRMDDSVSYGHEVLSVEPDAGTMDDLRVRLLHVTLRNTETGQIMVKLARNIAVAVGGVPVIPTQFEDLMSAKVGTHIAHSSAYLPSLAKMEHRLRSIEQKRMTCFAAQSRIDPDRSESAPLRFAVIGSGQSAAEISLHLRKTFPTSHVSLIFRASALVPSDDSAFVNSMAFDPERTDAFWRAGHEERMAWLKEFKRTNYSVVRSDMLNELHTEVYNQDIDFDRPWPHAEGPPTHGRLEILANTQVESVRLKPDDCDGSRQECIELTLRELKQHPAQTILHSVGSGDPHVQLTNESYDAIILATGFRRGPDCMSFLKPLQHAYPRLDTNAENSKALLGFKDELDTFDALARMQDEKSAERLRERSRGITRDYRLVGYASDAFSPVESALKQVKGSSATLAGAGASAASGTSTPRRGSDMSDSETLADSDEQDVARPKAELQAPTLSHDDASANAVQKLRGQKIEPGIYFLGGNEGTHGLSDSLLSIVAHRAGELTKSLLAQRRNFRLRRRKTATITSSSHDSIFTKLANDVADTRLNSGNSGADESNQNASNVPIRSS